jgi:hypothetical protein
MWWFGLDSAHSGYVPVPSSMGLSWRVNWLSDSKGFCCTNLVTWDSNLKWRTVNKLGANRQSYSQPPGQKLPTGSSRVGLNPFFSFYTGYNPISKMYCSTSCYYYLTCANG